MTGRASFYLLEKFSVHPFEQTIEKVVLLPSGMPSFTTPISKVSVSDDPLKVHVPVPIRIIGFWAGTLLLT